MLRGVSKFTHSYLAMRAVNCSYVHKFEHVVKQPPTQQPVCVGVAVCAASHLKPQGAGVFAIDVMLRISWLRYNNLTLKQDDNQALR